LSIANPEGVVQRLIAFQATVRDAIVRSRASAAMHEVSRSGAADHIYRIDAEIEPLLEAFCEEWAAEDGPIVLVAEGLEHDGREVESRVFPSGARDEDAKLRMIVDPIDGTRPIMYDKRAAWSLAGVAPNRGTKTRLRDIEVAVMTELPTTKMGSADVLSAIRGRGAVGQRVDLKTGIATALLFHPSTATDLEHCFATVVNFFPSTKVLAGELMEHIARHALSHDERGLGSLIFDDQYISTGGQFYELIVGHDRFNADLRPLLYRLQGRHDGFCCHPYDCAAALIAEEAGVILTDADGHPLDAPFDTTSDVAWVAYANDALRRLIEPAIREFFDRRRLTG